MTAIVNKELCTACGECVPSCPLDAIQVKDVAEIDAAACGDCGCCVDVCPVSAISLA